MERPANLFDREPEWRELARFVAMPLAVPLVAVVYGRRRQGKTYLLEELAAACGGFYHQALEEERAPALARIAGAVSAFAGAPELPGARFDDWATAFRSLAERAGGRLIVLDEFPYLVRTSPDLSSVIQAALDAAKKQRHPSFRLIICGSALSVMTELLTGQKALRGRATLDMSVHAFDFRDARRFWGVDDIETAFLLNAVLGGPPGYRDLLSGVGAPSAPDDLADWLAEGVLNPSHALFREAEYLLAEDPALTERSLYQSMIAAVAQGAATRGRLADRIGRPTTALEHPLSQLERSGFLIRDEDLLRGRRPLLRIVDPLLRFHFAVVRQDQARFESRKTADAWVAAQERFRSNVLGPHFETMARHWATNYASEETLGGRPRRVGFAQVNDPAMRQQFELDVVAEAEGSRSDGKPRLLAIGEAKAGDDKRTLSDLNRLDRLRSELATRADVTRTKLLLFGRSGFRRDLKTAAGQRADVELIDLERLYKGT